MSELKTLFLDFDGVLFNTLKEAYLICRCAYSKIDFKSPIDQNEFSKFYKFKFLVYNSWQYYYLMKTLLDKSVLSDKEVIRKYKTYLKDRDFASEAKFNEAYYSTRKRMKDEFFDFWNSLEEPFPFFSELINVLKNKNIDVVIVSKKDFNSIKFRLKQYGLRLSDDKIYAKESLEKYQNKSDFINEYIVKNNVKKAIFIDDNSNNLDPCKNIKCLETFLAGWGNIAIDEIGLNCYDIINKIKTLL